MRDAAVAVNPDMIVLCHGGPLAEPEDAQYVLDRTEGVVGFFGASSMERLPTEVGDHREHAPLQGADCVSPIGIALNCSVVSDSACSTGRRSTLDAPTNPTAPVRPMT